MNNLYDQGALQRLVQRMHTREWEAGRAVGGVPRVPDHVHVVADGRNPVKPQVHIDTLLLVVGLQQQHEAGPRRRCVLGPGGGLHSREAALRQMYVASGDAGPKDHSPARAPGRVEIDLGIGAFVEIAEAHERCQGEATARGDRVLQLTARPPVPSGRHRNVLKELERLPRRVEEPLNVDLEMSPFCRSPPSGRHSNSAVCQSRLSRSDPVRVAMMSQLASSISSWRMPSTCGLGMKSMCPVVSQMPVRRTNPSVGAKPSSML